MDMRKYLHTKGGDASKKAQKKPAAPQPSKAPTAQDSPVRLTAKRRPRMRLESSDSDMEDPVPSKLKKKAKKEEKHIAKSDVSPTKRVSHSGKRKKFSSNSNSDNESANLPSSSSTRPEFDDVIPPSPPVVKAQKRPRHVEPKPKDAGLKPVTKADFFNSARHKPSTSIDANGHSKSPKKKSLKTRDVEKSGTDDFSLLLEKTTSTGIPSSDVETLPGSPKPVIDITLTPSPTRRVSSRRQAPPSEEKTSPNKISATTSPAKHSRKEIQSTPVAVERTSIRTPAPSHSKKEEKTKKQDKSPKKLHKTPAATPTTADKRSTQPETPKTDGSAAKKASYASFMHRAPPQALGSRQIPEGAPNCLANQTFVITGVLETVEREQAEELIKNCGGKVTHNVSGRTSFLITGRDAGPSKLEKARKCGVKQITEEELFEMVEKAPGKAESEVKKSKAERALENYADDVTSASPVQNKATASPMKKVVQAEPAPETDSAFTKTKKAVPVAVQHLGPVDLWVDRYRPKALKQVIGQQGDRSCMNKLLQWLRNWHRNYASGKNAKSATQSYFGNRGNDDGATCKAALLSGPPGIGKTTSAVMCCQEAKLRFIEMNASDCRSKKKLGTQVADSVAFHSIDSYFGGKHQSQADHDHVLIMDEIDGMSGNEDRGGMQEVIALIKKSKVPIICICNDRQNQKIRSLANYCFDLRYQRPQTSQIRSAMMSICFKEGIKLKAPQVDQIIEASNHDIRQVLHNLSMLAAGAQGGDANTSGVASKDLAAGNPFEITRMSFTENAESRKMSLNEKAEQFFFSDYNFMPLFTHENYLRSKPSKARNDFDLLKLASKSASCIATGDLISQKIRSSGSWSLLPSQAFLSTVIPCEYMRGYMTGMVQFPSWLGNNSKRTKFARLTQQLQQHAGMKLSSDTRSLCLDYLPVLRHKFISTLRDTRAGVATEEPTTTKKGKAAPVPKNVFDAVELMIHHELAREDLDAMLEVTGGWSTHGDQQYSSIESKIKAAFTREYNKQHHLLPYATGDTAKVGRKAGGGGQEYIDEEGIVRRDGAEEAEEEEAEADEGAPQQKKATGRGKTSARGRKK